MVRANGSLDFLMWPQDGQSDRFVKLAGETALVDSFHWLAFCDRVVRLPSGTNVSATMYKLNPIETSVVEHQGQMFSTGTFIGLASIVIERMGAVAMTIHVVRNKGTLISKPRRVVDWRQTVVYVTTMQSNKHELVFGLVSEDTWIPWKESRYVVLAPRHLVAIAVTWSDVMHRMLLLGLILGTSVGFLYLRLVCRQIDLTYPLDRIDLLFDTFARTLGLPAGTSFGRSRAEHLLLIDISIFALLMSSVLSGVLYQRTMNQVEVERFNTLEDLCDSHVPVIFDGHILFLNYLLTQTDAQLKEKK